MNPIGFVSDRTITAILLTTFFKTHFIQEQFPMTVPSEHHNCPKCGTPVSRQTINRFNGVCRRCHQQPIGLRKQWIVLFIMAVFAIVAAVVMNQELVAMEKSGDSKRVNIIIAMAYRMGGRVGVNVFFTLIAILCTGLGIRAFRQAKQAKVLIESSKKNLQSSTE